MSPAAAPFIARVLSIAGTDPSGGAGIQADLKTFAACGVYGMAVTTAVVAQNTRGVRRMRVLGAGLVAAQLEAVLDDVDVDAIKLGMLGNAAVVRRVAHILRQRAVPAVVLDPVLNSSSGTALLEPAAVDVLRDELLPLVTVLTPNLQEAAQLGGYRGVLADGAMAAAAVALRSMGPDWVWLKGGHRQDGRCADVLAGPDGLGWLETARVGGPGGRGTGCTLSAALAAGLPYLPVREAALRAKNYLFQALRQASRLDVGRGMRPLHHGHGGPAAPLTSAGDVVAAGALQVTGGSIGQSVPSAFECMPQGVGRGTPDPQTGR